MAHRPKNKRPEKPRASKDWLYGFNPVEMALQAGVRRTFKVYLKEGTPSIRLARIQELAAQKNVDFSFVDLHKLDSLSGTESHQGVVLECGAIPLRSEQEAIRQAQTPDGILLALDQINDPQNLGAAIRNAAAFGIGGVVLPKRQSAPPTPTASKASAGRLEALPLYEVGNLARFLDQCRKSNVWVVGTDEEGSTTLPKLNLGRPLIVVMGSEQKGLRPLVQSKCDAVVSIPTPGGGSLNVAAATAIILYQLVNGNQAG